MDAPRKLRKGEKTRQRLMDAARQVFLRDGYLNAEISQIVRVAGKSAGAFYIYFENKSSILDSLLDEFDITFPSEENKYYELQTPQELHARLSIIWDNYKVHCSAFYALAQAAMVDEHFAKRESELRQRARDDIRHMIRARKRLGLCKSLDLTYATSSLEIMFTYCLHDWLAVRRRKFRNAQEEQRAFDSLVGIFITVLGLDHVRREAPANL